MDENICEFPVTKSVTEKDCYLLYVKIHILQLCELLLKLSYRSFDLFTETEIDVPRFNGHSYLKFEDKALFRQ